MNDAEVYWKSHILGCCAVLVSKELLMFVKIWVHLSSGSSTPPRRTVGILT